MANRFNELHDYFRIEENRAGYKPCEITQERGITRIAFTKTALYYYTPPASAGCDDFEVYQASQPLDVDRHAVEIQELLKKQGLGSEVTVRIKPKTLPIPCIQIPILCTKKGPNLVRDNKGLATQEVEVVITFNDSTMVANQTVWACVNSAATYTHLSDSKGMPYQTAGRRSRDPLSLVAATACCLCYPIEFLVTCGNTERLATLPVPNAVRAITRLHPMGAKIEGPHVLLDPPSINSGAVATLVNLFLVAGVVTLELACCFLKCCDNNNSSTAASGCCPLGSTLANEEGAGLLAQTGEAENTSSTTASVRYTLVDSHGSSLCQTKTKVSQEDGRGVQQYTMQ